MSVSIFTNWGVGAINGYVQKENGLPNGIKYGTIGLTTFMSMIKVIGNWDVSRTVTAPGHKLVGICIGVPLVMAANFCAGHHMGKAFRYAEDLSKSSTNTIQ